MVKLSDSNSENISLNFSIKLRTFLLIVALLAYLPATLFTLYQYRQAREKTNTKVHEEVEQTLELTDTIVEKAIGDVERTLILLANSSVVKNGTSEECGEFLENTLHDYSQYVNFGVTDENGNVVCSALAPAKQVNLSNRSYFASAKELRSLAVGKYRINQITQEPSVGFGYPILGESNEVEKVVFANVDVDWFNSLTKNIQVSEDVAINLIDKKGTLLARQPSFETWVGKEVADKPLVSTVFAQNKGETTASGLDGIERYYKFLPVSSYGVNPDGYLAVGSPLQDRLFEVDKTFIPIITFLGFGSGFLALALFLGKPGSLV